MVTYPGITTTIPLLTVLGYTESNLDLPLLPLKQYGHVPLAIAVRIRSTIGEVELVLTLIHYTHLIEEALMRSSMPVITIYHMPVLSLMLFKLQHSLFH
jgi:hypothetical protein